MRLRKGTRRVLPKHESMLRRPLDMKRSLFVQAHIPQGHGPLLNCGVRQRSSDQHDPIIFFLLNSVCQDHEDIFQQFWI